MVSSLGSLFDLVAALHDSETLRGVFAGRQNASILTQLRADVLTQNPQRQAGTKRDFDG
jgi:hypothetical protein